MDTTIGQARRTEGAQGTGGPRGARLAGGSALLLGVGLVGYMVAFGVWLASTRVNIDGDPAAQPERFAQQLINGASSPMWALYLALAAAAVFAFAASAAVGARVSSGPAAALGYASMVTLAIAFVLTSEITQKAGSNVLPKQTLEAAVPAMFGVVIPGLLAAFDLIAAAWTLLVSWIGWRSGAAPKWLCVVGALTGLGLVAGTTGAAGVELLIAPWLICVGVWLSRSSKPQA